MSLFYTDIDRINPEDETERLVVWSLPLLSWGLWPRLTRLVMSMIRIGPISRFSSPLMGHGHRYRNVLHRPVTPIDAGLRRRLLCRTRSTSGRGSDSPLMRAFAGLKLLLIHFTSPLPLPMPYPRGWRPAADGKGVVSLDSRATTRRLCSTLA